MAVLLAAGLLTNTAAAAAQSAGIVATVDRNDITLVEQLLLTVTVQGSTSAQPEMPPLPDFAVYDRGRSTQMQFINGASSSSVIYTYQLVPKAVGTPTIGPVTVTIDGKSYASRPFKVRIRKASDTPADSREAFVTATLSKRQAHVSEQLVFTWRFYRRVRITQASIDLPAFDGFLSEDLGKQRDFETTVEGQRFQVTEIQKALFPQEAGTLKIAASRLTVEVVVRNQRRRPQGFFDDPFSDFFGQATSTQTRILQTPEIEVAISDLPPAPKGFSGLVGRFTLQGQLSKEQIAVGESTTLTLTVSGQGNAQRIPEPMLDGLDAFKVYDDKPTASLSTEGGGVGGSRSFRKALVPLRPGKVVLPGARLIYFDTEQNDYRTIRSAAFQLQVRPGAVPEDLRLTESLSPAGGKIAVKVLAEDILPNYERLDAVAAPLLPWRNPLLVATAALLPPLCFGVLLMLMRRRERFAQNASERRRRLALRQGLRSLAPVDRAHATGKTQEAAQLASRALRAFLGDKLGLEGGAMTASEARSRLEARSVDAALVGDVQRLLEQCEAAQYGAGAGQPNGDLPLGRQLKGLIKNLDRELRA